VVQEQDHFKDRLGVVRKRFARSLENKINDTQAEVPSLLEGHADAVEAVANAYRRIHGICGVGGAVGFPATGRAAKNVEDVLIVAYRAQRGLGAAEIMNLQTALSVLTAIAEKELHSNVMSQASKDEA
jgi:hypothetical protein